jgi:hypothetical protein
MTLDEFKLQVRLNRGKLTKHDEDLETIFMFGIDELIQFTLEKKLMGVKNIASVALLPTSEQVGFCSFMAEKEWKANKNELELWFSQNTELVVLE